MSSSSIPCVVEKCELASLALCQCCKKDLCIDHLNEHASQRNGKLLPFIDKINVLLNRFNEFYAGDRSIRKQLDQWRDNAYKVIQNFYDKKRQELNDEATDQQREQLNEIHQKLKELIRKKGGTQEDFDTFSNEMRSVEQYLNKLQQSEVTLPPLTIDEQCILRPLIATRSTTTIQTDSIETVPNKSSEHSDNSSQKSTEKKKSSKKRKKSSRYSDDGSSDRSSHRRSRSPRHHSERSKKRKFIDHRKPLHIHK